MKNTYTYGNCIPVSEEAYNRLKKKGYDPVLIAGYVSVNDEDLFFEYNNQARKNKVNHTYLICGKHRIDLTRNQFDIYGGIDEYLKPKHYYIIEGNKFIIRKTLKEIRNLRRKNEYLTKHK